MGERRSKPGVSKKIGEKWGRGEREGGGGGEKRNRGRFLRSPHPFHLLLFFRTPSQFRSLCVRFLEMQAKELN